jgi:hypothetical protein
MDMHSLKKLFSLGAVAVVCETLPSVIAEGVTYLQVNNTTRRLPIWRTSFMVNLLQK